MIILSFIYTLRKLLFHIYPGELERYCFTWAKFFRIPLRKNILLKSHKNPISKYRGQVPAK